MPPSDWQSGKGKGQVPGQARARGQAETGKGRKEILVTQEKKAQFQKVRMEMVMRCLSWMWLTF